MYKNTYMKKIGINSRIASKDTYNLNEKKRNKVLKEYCTLLKINKKKILKENNRDMLNARKAKTRITNRLQLDSIKINNLIKSIEKISKLKNPLGKTLATWKRPNGLIISRVTIPIGVIAVIYESRPNVTSDVSALCFKTGNPVILRGGSEAFYSNKILSDLFRRALKKNKLNQNYVQFIKSKNRNNVDYLLSKMQDYVDILIPRGGKNLIKKVKTKSKIPTIGHLEGLCHVYVDKEADLNMAIKIVKNAKMRNFSICGAAETLLIDKKCIKTHCEPILNELLKLGCKIIGDKYIKKNINKKIKIASTKDWSTEYLAPIISVKSVNGVQDAIDHINKYGTFHTDSIVTKNKKTANEFLKK